MSSIQTKKYQGNPTHLCRIALKVKPPLDFIQRRQNAN